jgi:cytosine/adenosine deaminase-related metal-dependent hydrolase
VGSILIRGKYAISSVTAAGKPTVVMDGAVLQRDGEVVDVGPSRDLRARHTADEEIGSVHHLIIPGLVNALHHVGLTPFQLGILDLPLELWAVARLGVKQADPYLETLYSAVQMLESGITTVVHLQPLQRLRACGMLDDSLVPRRTLTWTP